MDLEIKHPKGKENRSNKYQLPEGEEKNKNKKKKKKRWMDKHEHTQYMGNTWAIHTRVQHRVSSGLRRGHGRPAVKGRRCRRRRRRSSGSSPRKRRRCWNGHWHRRRRHGWAKGRAEAEARSVRNVRLVVARCRPRRKESGGHSAWHDGWRSSTSTAPHLSMSLSLPMMMMVTMRLRIRRRWMMMMLLVLELVLLLWTMVHLLALRLVAVLPGLSMGLRMQLKHLQQPSADRRLELCAVARDFHFPVGVPRVAQAACAIERESRRHQPFDAKRPARGGSLGCERLVGGWPCWRRRGHRSSGGSSVCCLRMGLFALLGRATVHDGGA